MNKCEQCIVRQFSSLKALNKDELIRMAECKRQHCANPSWCKLTNKCLVALFPNATPEPDCRTCARCYSTKGRGVYGCDSVVGCTNGARYQPLPPVRLYRTNVGVEPVTPATEER